MRTREVFNRGCPYASDLLEGGLDDTKVEVRTVPTVFTEEEPQDRQAPEPRHLQDTSGRREARARRAVLQARLTSRVSIGDLRDQLQATLGAAYALDRELGGGGMSRVFLATEISLGRQVVVKV